MLKSKSFIPHDRPIYREVIPHALTFAWKHPLFWFLGLFAAVFNTSGALDVFWKFWNAVQSQGTDLFVGHAALKIWYAAQAGGTAGINWLPFARGLVGVLMFFVIFVAIAAFSFIAQGALVYAIGGWTMGGRKALLKKSLTVGAKAAVPIAVLNILLVVFVWIARFGASLPLAMALGRDSGVFAAVYVVSFIVFTVVAILFSIMQVYALNAMVMQGANLAKAMARAWKVVREHWLVTLETAILQSLVIVILGIGATLVLTLLCLPPILLFSFAVMSANSLLMEISVGVLTAIVFLATLAFAGFAVTFQYSTWTMVFRKFGEGGVAPKLHRLFRSLTGNTKVPQS